MPFPLPPCCTGLPGTEAAPLGSTPQDQTGWLATAVGHYLGRCLFVVWSETDTDVVSKCQQTQLEMK